MRNAFLKSLVAFSLPIALMSGCAKDQVKPDEGISPDKSASAAVEKKEAALVKPTTNNMAVDNSAADRAAAEKAAAERAAAEKAAAERAAAEKAAAEKAATERAAAVTLSLKTVYFDFDSYILRQSDRDTLYKNAEYLLKKYNGKVKLEGHCDERGSDEYNLALGENRAKAALNYLVTLGVPSEQLSVVSYGKEKPVDAGHTEEAWTKNRRVEFTVVK
jgi:peptidoglycan-associated lipoprotein